MANKPINDCRRAQFIQFLNSIFCNNNKETQRRDLCHFKTPNITPIDRNSKLVEFSTSQVSFDTICHSIASEKNFDCIDTLGELMKTMNQLKLKLQNGNMNNENKSNSTSMNDTSDGNNNNNDNRINVNEQQQYEYELHKEKSKLFEQMQNDYFSKGMLDEYVSRSLVGNSYTLHSSTAELFSFKKHFAQTLAFINLFHIIFQYDERNLNKYILQMDTGELMENLENGFEVKFFDDSSCLQWGDDNSYSNNESKENNNNQTSNNNMLQRGSRMMLRVTQNLRYFLEPTILDGIIITSLFSMCRALSRDNSDDDNNSVSNNEKDIEAALSSMLKLMMVYDKSDNTMIEASKEIRYCNEYFDLFYKFDKRMITIKKQLKLISSDLENTKNNTNGNNNNNNSNEIGNGNGNVYEFISNIKATDVTFEATLDNVISNFVEKKYIASQINETPKKRSQNIKNEIEKLKQEMVYNLFCNGGNLNYLKDNYINMVCKHDKAEFLTNLFSGNDALCQMPSHWNPFF